MCCNLYAYFSAHFTRTSDKFLCNAVVEYFVVKLKFVFYHDIFNDTITSDISLEKKEKKEQEYTDTKIVNFKENIWTMLTSYFYAN